MQNNCTTNHATMNEKLRELLDFPELGSNDDRSGEVINRGFAMLLVPSVFKDFANGRINLSKQKKEASDRQLALKKAEKKRAEERKKIIDDAAHVNFLMSNIKLTLKT